MLLIGNSRIGRRRVLPAIRATANISAVAIASRTARADDIDAGTQFFSDYEAAIAHSKADLAWVSVTNSDHARWAERCLEAGLHVIVDKPMCLKAGDAERLANLAAAKSLCLAEATVFSFHPQFEALHRAFEDAGTRPTRAIAIFSFPPLDPHDFRYRRELGGGALYDLGPYAAATSRLIFGRAPHSVSCQVLSRTADGLETAFSVLLTYDNGGALVGHFGFDTEYQNRLLVLGPDLAVEIERAFTPPPDTSGRLSVRRKNLESEIEIAPSDAFQNFFRAVLDAVKSNKCKNFLEALVADAQLLAKLRQAGGEF